MKKINEEIPYYNKSTNTDTRSANEILIGKILWDARNKSWGSGIMKTVFNNFSDTIPITTALISFVNSNKNYDPKILKAAVTLIFRESKGSSAYINLNYKEILGYFHNLFGGDHSQGYAQIQPSVAKQYGVDVNSLYTVIGSLKAAYTMLSKNYNYAKKFYSGPQVTIFDNGNLVKKPAIDGDAALHLAVAAHNGGLGLIGKWCETNVKNIANKCDVTSRKPYDNYIVATTNKSKVIPNYFPNKGDGPSTTHTYMPQFIKCYNELSLLPGVLNKISSSKTKSSTTSNKPNMGWDGYKSGDLRYWKVLYAVIKKLGLPVQLDSKSGNKPENSKYYTNGSWVIWKDRSKNGGYFISSGNGTINKTSVVGKITSYEGRYVGEDISKTIVELRGGNKKKYTLLAFLKSKPENLVYQNTKK
jgi:hypothetical protein